VTRPDASGRAVERIDLDAMERELRQYEQRFGRPSSQLHSAFRWRVRECEDERAWASLYSTLRAFGRV
jgi:hypothetical protein